ncbi:SPOR domain-containing protein [Vibrio algicola]|uniref:Cell division protein DedD n=1 Tax=Vibrio algicola TaxID=2662262 RepID=A0A5Q0TF99_9VIBR|nr:SPOR domain-containing protein [Vibrio algicola]
MASKFQSRLIGTVILVAIGVIVLPDIFDGQKEHYKEEFAAIPIKPTDNASQAQENVEDIKDPVDLDVALPEEPVSAVTVTSQPAKVTKKKAVKAKPAIKEAVAKSDQVAVESKPVREVNHYSDSAWIIQLVAVRNQDNAKKLVADLKKRGYQAHLKPDSGLYRVIVGPDISKDKLEKQVAELQKITGLKGQLQTFKPLNP